MKRIIAYIIIVTCLVFAVGDYYYSQRDSYNRYLEGEYYFRYLVHTTEAPDPMDLYLANPNASLPDYSDPKEILLQTTNAAVYAYAPHDGVCSVIYGDNVIEGFPLYRLRFDGNDKEYFTGSRQYTYEEYIELLNGLSKDQLKSYFVSDSKMANYNNIKDFLIIIVGFDVVLFMVLFILKRSNLETKYDLVLFIASLYSIFWEIITYFVF